MAGSNSQSVDAGTTWRQPPQNVVDVVEAPRPPILGLSPDRRLLLYGHYDILPPLSELARPLHRLAGLRFHPDTFEEQRPWHFTRFEVEDLSTGERREIDLPQAPCAGMPRWAPDGRSFSFTRTTDGGVELWSADATDGRARRLLDPVLNHVAGDATSWCGEGDRLLCLVRPSGEHVAPTRALVPAGPLIEDTAARRATNRTWQDLLETPHDEDLFRHYIEAQVAIVDLGGTVRRLGDSGLIWHAEPSPDGRWILVARLLEPFSTAVPASLFARRLEVWNAEGDLVRVLAEQPIADEVPIEGVRTGPRSVGWKAGDGATLRWLEALDGGDPSVEAEARDRVLLWSAPFADEAREIARTQHRCAGLSWLSDGRRYLLTDYDRDRRWIKTVLESLDPDVASGDVIFDRSVEEAYADPGSPVTEARPDGTRVVRTRGDKIWLAGDGASEKGDRPFLDEFDLKTKVTKRLFQSGELEHASFRGFADDGAGTPRLLVTRETRKTPPNHFLEEPGGVLIRQLTEFEDPHPWITGIAKEVVNYQRDDGLELSGTLYLPEGHVPGTPLPLVISAYPVEYTDHHTAGQVDAQPNTFTRLEGTSPLLFLTRGFAVLADATMPVVGSPETANDTFIEQVSAAAKAAVDAMVARGVADPARVGIMGHSYGAFVTATLLAHTDLFAAGIARSGAYNRTLTPFGFQRERRTLWEAQDTYLRLSPLMAADKITAPILMIHGELDPNPGTYPSQTRRLFRALEGLGGTARMILLPHEGHGYVARESILHVAAESLDWFERHLASDASDGA